MPSKTEGFAVTEQKTLLRGGEMEKKRLQEFLPFKRISGKNVFLPEILLNLKASLLFVSQHRQVGL